jgi:hypothetical protein
VLNLGASLYVGADDADAVRKSQISTDGMVLVKDGDGVSIGGVRDSSTNKIHVWHTPGGKLHCTKLSVH